MSQKIASFTRTTTGRHLTARGYGANGNTTSVATTLDGAGTPNVSSITATYTTADEPATWTETLWNPSGTAAMKAWSWSYLPDGPVKKQTLPGNTTIGQAFDAADRLAEQVRRLQTDNLITREGPTPAGA